MSTSEGPYAEVAVPVPLRQLFTYRIPESLRLKLKVGSRVAVPFQRRKVAAYVVAFRDEPPAGVTRLSSIAGLIEPDPIFEPELLRFLEEAARYYFHPLGEVLRAAAPAVPTGALKRLRKGGFLSAEEALPGRTIARRFELYIRLSKETTQEGVRLGKAQLKILGHVRKSIAGEADEVSLGELREIDKRARSIVRALQDKGLVHTEEREVASDLFETSIMRDTPPVLNNAQVYAVDALVSALDAPQSTQFLLHGVTGSGKTEVYLHAIDACRKRGKGALLLVPEIALTPQLVGRFRARFGDELAVLHSGLKERQRDDAWRGLREGKVRLAVGARSALFAPVPNLGLLIVDEEHDSSFKQEEGFRYHARDMALLRAHRAGAVVVLGSATPSVESFYRTESGDATLLSLPERAAGQEMPPVEIIDLRKHKARTGSHRMLSGPLEARLRESLEAGDQSILFLNRRGFSPSVRCLTCGEVLECPACSVALTEHRRAGRLRCHYCDFERPTPRQCPKCQSPELGHLGLGTEQLEDTLAELLAPARIARLDRDVASGRGAESVLERFRDREIDVLVGTQMVTKGHDLPGVTVVGVLSADQSLSFPDFRSTERTFQLLAQVAGRAGRGKRAGRVVFQTYQPDHPAILAAASHDYEAFYRAELAARKELFYPPFGWLTAIRVNDISEARAKNAAGALADLARRHPSVQELRVLLQGPAPAPITRIRGRFRFRVFLRSEDRRALRNVSATLASAIAQGIVRGARASVDIDPVSML